MDKNCRNLILLSCLFFAILRGYSQDPDSITVISMTGVRTDTVPPHLRTTSHIKPARKDNFWRRIQLGGNLGFQFGTITGFNISPEAKIRTVDQLYVGVGFIYQYFKYNDYFYDWDNQEFINYSSNTFGGRIFLRYYLRSLFDGWAGNFYAHVEYEYLNYVIPFEQDPNGPIEDPFNNRYKRGTDHLEIQSVFVGGGYSQPVTDRIFIDLLVLFNLNDSPESPYTNPVFRLGVGVGL